MFGSNMETVTQQFKLDTCKNCEFNKYEVQPNFNICTKTEGLPISIVIQKEACPVGKW